MFRKIPAPALAVTALCLLVWACSKPTPFGGDLLDDQLADYDFTDTLSLNITVEREDSSLQSNDRNIADYQLCGELNDPIFGKSSAEIFTSMLTGNSAINFQNPRYRYDSLVMYLKLNPTGYYGDTLSEQTLRIFRLSKGIETGDSATYYTNSSIEAGEQVGEVKFFPRVSRQDSLISETARASYVRIKLSDSFGQELFGLDSLTYASDTAFEKAFRGLKIVSASTGNPGAVLALGLNDVNFSLMRMFYTRDDTVKGAFFYQFRNAHKFVRTTHEYNGAPIANQIGQTNGDYIYAQGMAGLRFKVEFPTAASLDNIAVNKAELVLTIAKDVPNDNPLLYATSQLVAGNYATDSSFTFTPDVLYSIGVTGSDGFGRFGGFPEKRIVNNQEVTQYRFTLTKQFQRIVDDTSGDKNKRTVWFFLSPGYRLATRAIMYGTNSSVYKPKLELKYTKVR